MHMVAIATITNSRDCHYYKVEAFDVKVEVWRFLRVSLVNPIGLGVLEATLLACEDPVARRNVD